MTAFTPEVADAVTRLETAGWEVQFRYITGFMPTWNADRFVTPSDPLCPPTAQAKVLVQYAAGDVFQLARTCGVQLPAENQ